jgi:hypothetical protein
VEQCNSDRKQPRPITHKIINNNKNNKNKTGSGFLSELHCSTACFIFIIFIIIDDFMSYWSLIVFCQNYIVPLPV